MVNLKDNVWIEGFDKEIDIAYYELAEAIGSGLKDFIYKGKTSDITEEIAKEVLLSHPYSSAQCECYFEYDNPELDLDNTSCQCRDNPNKSRSDYLWDWKESIQSACNQEYCIIFKK